MRRILTRHNNQASTFLVWWREWVDKIFTTEEELEKTQGELDVLEERVDNLAHSEINLDDGSNPHNTTKADVGLGNADNTSDANKPVSTAQQAALNGKLDSVQEGTNITIDNTDPNNPIISSTGGGGTTNHSGLTLDDGTNPHGTTAADVGLGNVDNTSDLDKPVSTATQSALDDKLEDAPSDGNNYGRKDGAWEVITTPVVPTNNYTRLVDPTPSFESNSITLDSSIISIVESDDYAQIFCQAEITVGGGVFTPYLATVRIPVSAPTGLSTSTYTNSLTGIQFSGANPASGELKVISSGGDAGSIEIEVNYPAVGTFIVEGQIIYPL